MAMNEYKSVNVIEHKSYRSHLFYFVLGVVLSSIVFMLANYLSKQKLDSIEPVIEVIKPELVNTKVAKVTVQDTNYIVDYKIEKRFEIVDSVNYIYRDTTVIVIKDSIPYILGKHFSTNKYNFEIDTNDILGNFNILVRENNVQFVDYKISNNRILKNSSLSLGYELMFGTDILATFGARYNHNKNSFGISINKNEIRTTYYRTLYSW